MGPDSFMTYLRENFTLSIEAQRIIEEILRYAAGCEDEEDAQNFLCDMLCGTIGVEVQEVKMFHLA